MIQRAPVTHNYFLPFRQALARTKMNFSLLAASGDLQGCTMHWFKRSEPQTRFEAPMTLRADDGCKAQWICGIDFPEEAHYIKYAFELISTDERLFFCENGFSDAMPEAGLFELLQVNESDVPRRPEWAMGCTFYQIFPERFCGALPARREYDSWYAEPTRENFLGGDLPGIRSKLPYLKSLGVDCLYLNPVFRADFNHKYATTDYFSIDPDFGTNEDLKALVKAAHESGIRVILDGVFNHVGTHFKPFEDVLANGRESRYANWFYIKKTPVETDASCYECVGDYPYMPRLRVAEPQAREYVRDVLLYWIEEAGIDGWRFDVADELDFTAVRYWREAIRDKYPDALMLAETWGDASHLVLDGSMFDNAMNYLFRDAALDYFAREAIDETVFAQRIERMRMKYPDEVLGCMYNLLGSHDTVRLMTECGGDSERAKLAIAFQMTFLGSPALYYGDEIGMEGENDPGCRAGMRWSRTEDSELLVETRRLIALRNEHPALKNGSFKILLCDPERHLFAFERRSETERIAVLFNRGNAPQSLDDADLGGQVDIRPHAVKIVIHSEGGTNHE